MLARFELDAALVDLERRLPVLIAEHPNDADFWPEFAGIADEIIDSASANDYEHACARVDTMLGQHQLSSGQRQETAPS